MSTARPRLAHVAAAGLALASLAAALVAVATPAGAAACPVHTFSHPSVAEPSAIVAGPDGNLWFTARSSDRLGRITPAGAITTFALPAAPDGGPQAPADLVVGPDGHVWASLGRPSQTLGELRPGAIAEIDPGAGGTAAIQASLVVHAVPAMSGIEGITAAADDRLWYVGFEDDTIGKWNPATDAHAEFNLGASAAGPLDVVGATDGRLWIASLFSQGVGGGFGRLARWTDGGSPPLATFPSASVNAPFGVATGPGSTGEGIWFTSFLNDRVGRIRPDGTGLQSWTAVDVSGPESIVEGPDGAMWFSTDAFPARLGRIASDGSGAITTYSAGDANGTVGVAVGPDGNIWFTDPYDDLVGWIDPDAPGPRFVDVPSTHPFCQEVAWMDEEAISTGYGDRTYRPADAVSRQAMSAFLFRFEGEPAFDPPATPTFSDVPTDHPFYDAIEWMNAEGITTGYADGTYKPAAPVTRQAMSAFMQRLRPGGDPPPATPTFSDVPADHPFFADVEWMNAEGITTGYADGTYKPAAVVTRQAMSAFLFRLDAVPA